MGGPQFNFNKFKYKHKIHHFKHKCKYWSYKIKEGAKQIFIPLAIFQLIRTIIFPTPFDVVLLVLIFLIILYFFLDGY